MTALVGYLALTMMGLIKLYVLRSFQLSYCGIGPTEVRLLIAAGVGLALAGAVPSIDTPVGGMSLFDIVGSAIVLLCLGGAGSTFVIEARRLASIDPPRHLVPVETPMIEIDARRSA